MGFEPARNEEFTYCFGLSENNVNGPNAIFMGKL